MTLTPPAIVKLPADDYHADPCTTPSLSSSLIDTIIRRSPAHARAQHPRLNPDRVEREAGHFDIGSAAHALLLEQDDSLVTPVAAADWRSKQAQQIRASERAAHRIPLLEREWEQVQATVAAVRDQLAQIDADPPLLQNGKPEMTMVWEDDGVTCRALADWLHDDGSAIDDLKTTSLSASPEGWSRTMFDHGSDIQAAFYMRGLEALTGRRHLQFRFIVAEITPPYGVSVFTISPDVRAVADAKIDRALHVWRRGVATGVWPGYPRRVCHIELPPWIETRWLERDERGFGEETP